MKLSVGLFHFNVQWHAGDLPSYHRYCAESVGPLLRALCRHPSWRVSIEFAGTCLGFLKEHYPDQFGMLQQLIAKDQIELISSLYTPALWPAFPGRDLERSVRLNREHLRRLDLPSSRIFTAQEAFFGEGLRTLSEYFDAAVCKDDQIGYFTRESPISPIYRLGQLKVLVASNHLLKEIGSYYERRPQEELRLPPDHVDYLHRTRENNRGKHTPAATGACGDFHWKWYHFGDGNHYSVIYTPTEWRSYRADDVWASHIESMLCSYEEDGFQFGTVSDLLSALETYPAQEIDGVIEGGWNTSVSRGALQWMGHCANSWEDDLGILSYVYRIRSLLAQCEDAAKSASIYDDPWIASAIDRAWAAVLAAQSSDPLGWYPSRSEVRSGIDAANTAYAETQNAIERVRMAGVPVEPSFRLGELDPISVESAFVEIGTVNLRGTLSVFAMGPAHQVVYFYGYAQGVPCGLTFGFSLDYIQYCPSGLERTAACWGIERFPLPLLVLPLANGLLALKQGIFLIKDAGTCHLAVQVDGEAHRASFFVEGHAPSTFFTWRFVLYKGGLQEAIELANRINCV
jgi:hypothetical protein